MKNITTLGIDIAKNVFQLHGVDSEGRTVMTKRISRNKLESFMANLPACVVGMEACASAHHWARVFRDMGHEVKLMNPQYVMPYVKTNKNDANDAMGICEAVTRPSMRFVPIKSIEQQGMSSLHRAREQIVKTRTALGNHARGLLAEYGITTGTGQASLCKLLAGVCSGEIEVPEDVSFIFCDIYTHYKQLCARKSSYDNQIKKLAHQNKDAQRIMSVPGIGPITATALVSKVGNVESFQSARHFAAWLGLIPKQNSSGNKRRLLGISKRGDVYIRSLLVHGARAVIKEVARQDKKESLYYAWCHQLHQSKKFNVATVALANKNARVIWALLKHGRCFDANFVKQFDSNTIR